MSIQMTCPYCHREFPYNNGKLDKEISEVGQRILHINRRLAEIKYGHHDKSTWDEKKRLTKELTGLQARSRELKDIRKAADQQVKQFEFMIWKEIIKDRLGEVEYRKIIDQVNEELQAYKESGLMRHEYTRSGSKSNVTSINKI